MLERVQKIISNSGFCSRRTAEEFIALGHVRVNGKRIKLGDKADVKTDKITVKDRLIKTNEKVYIALYKPKRYVSTLYDPEGRKTIKELVTKLNTRVYPVGRLDNYAEGLLLMTNDGDFSNKIMHPRYKIEKVYLAKTNKELLPGDLGRLKDGVQLDEGLVTPDKVVYHGNRLYEVTLHQGMNRVVKRLFETLGYKVYALMRIQIGNIKLQGIKRGHYRFLTDEEVASFK